MRVRTAKISLLVFVIVRGLRDAREQDGDGHPQSDSPADPDLREGTWNRTHTLRTVAWECDAIGQSGQRSGNFTFVR